MRRLGSLPVVLALAGCATGTPVGALASLDEARHRPFTRGAPARTVPQAPAGSAAPLAVAPGARDRLVEAARRMVGERRVVLAGRTWPSDCTGLVNALYASEGIDLLSAAQGGDNGVTAIWRFAQSWGRTYEGGAPVAGDLVFFQETYDLNRDGARNDGLTHVGVVDSVEPDGTVLVIHRVARGVARYRMNLLHRDAAQAPGGKVLNDTLRAAGAGQPAKLTAQLFAGYATLLPVEPRFARR